MTREEAIQELQNCIGLIRQDGQDYLDERDIPLLNIAIEALQTNVVYCKDCIQKHIGGSVTHYYWCDLWDREVDDTDYCAWGERREP